MCERRERLGGRDYGISSGLAQLIVHNTPRCAEASSMGSETCVFFFNWRGFGALLHSYLTLGKGLVVGDRICRLHQCINDSSLLSGCENSDDPNGRILSLWSILQYRL